MSKTGTTVFISSDLTRIGAHPSPPRCKKGFLATSSLKTARDGFIYEILNHFVSFPQSRAGLAEFSSSRNLSADLPSLFSLLPLLNSFFRPSFFPSQTHPPHCRPLSFPRPRHNKNQTNPMHESLSKTRFGAAKGAWVVPVPAACERLREGRLPWVPAAPPLPHPQLLRSGLAASRTAEGRFKYVFPCSFPAIFLGETKKKPEINDARAVLDATALYSASGFLFGKAKTTARAKN